MKLIERTLPRTHRLYLFGDTHEGSILKHRKGVKKMKKRILADPAAYAFHMGDVAEGITIDDKRYCRDTIDPKTPTPVHQYNAAAEELYEIRDRLLGILDHGNHDWTIASRYGNSVENIVARELWGKDKAKDYCGTYSCKLSIKDSKGNLMYKSFLTHGNGSINSTADDPVRREANMHLSLKRKLHKKAGDCVIMAHAHTHKLLVKPPIRELYLTDDGKHIKQQYTEIDQTEGYIPPDLRWYINTGSFYKLYHDGVSSYAERASYDPVELGYAVVHVKDGIIKDVEKVIDTERVVVG